jgi:hypothetical protein
MNYKCLNCNEIHEEKHVALGCCYDPAQRYLCPVCDKTYYNYDNARYCCENEKVEVVEEVEEGENIP